jgi:hypothetical protein
VKEKWKLKSKKMKRVKIQIRMMMSTKTYQRAHTFFRIKKIADFAAQKNSSMNMRGYVARKEG